jgi:putative aldouronate transport system substrate-binding protein
LWYRDDWAAAAGVSRPSNFEDVLAMAVLFAQDPMDSGINTVGFGMSRELFGGGMTLKGFFSAYQAYPQQWYEVNGRLEQGSIIVDRVREPLLVLQDLYSQRVLDQDFINLGPWDTSADDIVAEKIGMAFAAIWFGDWRCAALMEARGDDSATWTTMAIPSLNGRPPNRPPVMVKQQDVVCIKAGYAFPEVAVKMVNYGVGLIELPEVMEGRFHNQPNPDAPGRVVNNFFHNLTTGVGHNGISNNYIHALAVTHALETGDTSALNDEQMTYYERSRGWVDRTNLAGYTSYSIFGPTGSQFTGQYIRENNLFYMEPFYGPSTDTMNENWGGYISKRDEVYTNIILGGDVDAGLTELVNYWTANFGDVITQEVNDWWEAEKNK